LRLGPTTRPEKLVRVKAEDILGKPLFPDQKAKLKRLPAMPDSEIDYSDIPKLTDQQIARFRRPWEVFVAARIDRDLRR